MPFKSLLDTWAGNRKPLASREYYSVQLPLEDAARVHALCEMFPGNNAEQIITDLLREALDEIEAAMPYVAGETVIREDEYGDPVFEDAGMTPRFLELVKKYRAELSGT